MRRLKIGSRAGSSGMGSGLCVGLVLVILLLFRIGIIMGSFVTGSYSIILLNWGTVC